MARNIREVMTRDVVAVKPDATLEEAAQLMRSLDVGPLPVVDNGRLAGMVTDRDIVVRAVAEGKDVRQCRVRDVMTEQVFSVNESDTIEQAAEQMRDLQVRRLLVLDASKKLVGIVAIGDLAVDADERTAGRALEGISTPAQPAQH